MSGGVVLDIQNGTVRLKIHKKEGQSVTLKFSSGDYKKLTGKLVSSDQWANIRLDQITMPDGG
ncbi:LSM domain-containing protein [Oxalobacter vibrioformis]|uniref:LSM domain-containing protein n=1 Tax=Oxalobacter vibrioformis TaxID=933080 RepID=A0A9E9LYR0_9BURK|nr:LSM domain-containing protein [Oxalobacter vibrioformis]WAW10105.1 LSM domain-containing protein [Oxalobacter vibrioformis]